MRVRSRPSVSNSKMRTPASAPPTPAALTLTEMLRSLVSAAGAPVPGRRSFIQAPPLPSEMLPRTPAFTATAWRSV